MYSPTLGRFISQDPIGFQAGDVNLYRFVENNPANATDPSGLIIERAVGAVASILLTGAQEPKTPTSANLSWNHFNKVKKGEFDAKTVGNIYLNYDDIKTSSKPDGCGFIGTATLKPKFRAVFDAEKSYVVIGQGTASLLKHERLHLAIAEYFAEKITPTFPERFTTAIAKGRTAEDAEANAKSDLIKFLDTKLDKARDLLARIQLDYDADTVRGTVAKEQAVWAMDYTKKVDKAVKTLDWGK